MIRQEFYEAAKRATVAMCLRDSWGNLIPFVSGVNISPDGLIVTCKHVIEDAQTDVWLDVERLKPGERWMEELERVLAESHSWPVRRPASWAGNWSKSQRINTVLPLH